MRIFSINILVKNSYRCSIIQSCLTLCSPMDCSTTGLPVPHCLPEFAQTQDHWVDDAIQQSHPLSPPSPPAFNPSLHQGLFQRFSSRSCFYWLYKASPSLAAKNMINLISDQLVMSTCRDISWVVGKGTLAYWQNFMLAFAPLHFVLQDQTCLLLQVSLDFLLLHSSPLWWKGHLFVCVCVCVSSRCCPSS